MYEERTPDGMHAHSKNAAKQTKILPNDYLRKNGVDCQPSALYPLEENR